MGEMHDEDSTTTSATELLSPETHDHLQIIKELETRPISSNKIIAEVKGIYAGLIIVEAKCCEIDAKQYQAVLAMDINTPTLNNEQWYAPILSTISITRNIKLMKYRQVLIAPYRTLLHEHHEVFLASQTQSAGTALKQLAPKYSMPARMWCH
jgi:hypothetical protein